MSKKLSVRVRKLSTGSFWELVSELPVADIQRSMVIESHGDRRDNRKGIWTVPASVAYAYIR